MQCRLHLFSGKPSVLKQVIGRSTYNTIKTFPSAVEKLALMFTVTEVHLRDAYHGTRSDDGRESLNCRWNRHTLRAGAELQGFPSKDTNLSPSTFYLWHQSFEPCSGRFYYYRRSSQESLSKPPRTGFVPMVRRPAESPKARSSMPLSVPHEKYWSQRRRLFSLFDHGVQLDTESWFSVTPECVAHHQAWRCMQKLHNDHHQSLLCDINRHEPLVIFDAFCGVGGNTIAFARHLNVHVFACDTDKERLRMASHNARVYNVSTAVSFLHGDALNIMNKAILKEECSPFSTRKIDMIFLSPPWGGPEYRAAETFDLSSILVSGFTLIQVLNMALKLCRNVAFFLPRNTDLQSLAAELTVPFKVEREYVNRKEKSMTLYFGKLAEG